MLASVFSLCAVSLLQLGSIDAGQGSSFLNRQLIFIFLGLAAMVAVSFLDVRMFKNRPLLLLGLYLLIFLLLVSVLVVGQRIRGSAAWFRFAGISFEPVELAKLVIILVLAKYFSGRHVEMFRVRHVLISAGYAGLPIILVLLQPDLGSVMVLVSIWLGIVILSGIKIRHLIVVLLTGVLVASLAWAFALKPYQKDRILTFLNPSKDPLGASYNVAQAKIAIGSGGWFGKGLGQGTQSQLNFLPEKHSDFIFAATGEEWGFAGILFVLGAFGVLFYRLIRLSTYATNNFSRLFVSGFAVMVFAQVVIHAGMNLGLMPVTGIPLPFMSAGGSNLLINFLALGVIQNIAAQTKKSTIF